MRPVQKTVAILLVDVDPDDARLVSRCLASAPQGSFSLQTAHTLAQASQNLAQGGVDVVLLEPSLPDSAGLQSVIRMREHASGVPILVLTPLEDESLALDALRAGAQDFLAKNSLSPEMLPRAIYHAVERKHIEEKLRASE